jgi:hypothetical protein
MLLLSISVLCPDAADLTVSIPPKTALPLESTLNGVATVVGAPGLTNLNTSADTVNEDVGLPLIRSFTKAIPDT